MKTVTVERPAPSLTATQNVAPAFPVPSACERMVFLARQEWALFGSPELASPGEAPPTNGNGAAAGGRLSFADPTAPTHELHAPMLTRAALVDGQVDAGVLPTGQVVGRVADLPTVAELVARIEAEAEAALLRLRGGVA